LTRQDRTASIEYANAMISNKQYIFRLFSFLIILRMSPPVDAAEFDAHKDIGTIIVQFLCRNKDKGFSAKEIAAAVGIKEEEVNHTMVKLGLTDLFRSITAGIALRRHDQSDKIRTLVKIEDATINGLIYYRCVEQFLV
jgi:hypothetical protein